MDVVQDKAEETDEVRDEDAEEEDDGTVVADTVDEVEVDLIITIMVLGGVLREVAPNFLMVLIFQTLLVGILKTI
eukprot:scaffold6192_cov68-Attheya_sp.AAC.1